MTGSREPVYVARRRFGPDAGERWSRYVAWSRLAQLREVVSLDGMLCPAVPEELIPEDWAHNVHADSQVTHFRSLSYLLRRVAGVTGLNILAILQNPSPSDLAWLALPDFELAGFDVVDVHGDVSALTNCGGFDGVFAPAELSPLGLLPNSGRADAVRRGLREAHPAEDHAECDVWAIWRWTGPAPGGGSRALADGGRSDIVGST